MRPVDLVDQRFGRLVAVQRVGSRKGVALWACLCDCGGRIEVTASSLRAGKTSSCGCLRAESARRCGKLSRGAFKHGLSRLPEYKVWRTLRQRCLNPRSADYPDYGGRGITVCERWARFETFLADMGRRPPGASIDRIDNDRGYEPGNCRWATAVEQARNRRPRRTSVEQRRAVRPEGGRPWQQCP